MDTATLTDLPRACAAAPNIRAEWRLSAAGVHSDGLQAPAPSAGDPVGAAGQGQCRKDGWDTHGKKHASLSPPCDEPPLAGGSRDDFRHSHYAQIRGKDVPCCVRDCTDMEQGLRCGGGIPGDVPNKSLSQQRNERKESKSRHSYQSRTWTE